MYIAGYVKSRSKRHPAMRFAIRRRGQAAADLSALSNITREAQDELAVESHRRALDAIQSGKFTEEIVPSEIKIKG